MTIKVKAILPTYSGYIHKETRKTIEDLQRCSEVQFDILIVPGRYLPVARNLGIDLARDTNDYYLTIDNDMFFFACDVIALMRNAVSVVSAAYLRRPKRERGENRRGESSSHFVGGYFREPFSGHVHLHDYISSDEKRLVKIDWTGHGCMLVHRDVFAKLSTPYFHINSIKGETPGVDISWGWRLKQEGIPFYMDCSVQVGHVIHSGMCNWTQSHEEEMDEWVR